jgi:hypothetical protein
VQTNSGTPATTTYGAPTTAASNLTVNGGTGTNGGTGAGGGGGGGGSGAGSSSTTSEYLWPLLIGGGILAYVMANKRHHTVH